MTSVDAKTYLAKKEIPQLFESLMTGLMYYRPEDHISYMQDCLKKVKEQGFEKVTWNIFIESRKKTPLPPISPDNGKRSSILRDSSFITDSRTCDYYRGPGIAQLTDTHSTIVEQIKTPEPSDDVMKFADDVIQEGISEFFRVRILQPGDRPLSLDHQRGSPLPPIGKTWQQEDPDFPDRIQLPNCPIVLVMGGPGSGKATQCKLLQKRYPGWVHLSMGDILREKIFKMGSADQKWDMIGTLVSKGQLAPEEMPIDLVVETIQNNMNADGILIEGFPRTMQQIEDYNKYIGRVDLAFVLDCEEYYLQQRLLNRGRDTGRVDDNINAVGARLTFFKDKTLPTIKYFDDLGKMCIVDGDRDAEEVFFDLAVLLDNMFYTKRDGPAAMPCPPCQDKKAQRGSKGGRRGSRPCSGFSSVASMLEISELDTGRQPGMPQCPIFSVYGGPGSSRSAASKKLAKDCKMGHISVGDLLRNQVGERASYSDDWRAIDDLMNEGDLAADLIVIEILKTAIMEAGSRFSKGIVLDGFPRTKQQVELFNQHIGGLTTTLLIDCEEDAMRENLHLRAATSGRADDNPTAIETRINNYKHQTLPVIAHLDDQDKLSVVDGERPFDEVYEDVYASLQRALLKFTPGPPMGVTAPITVEHPDLGRLGALPNIPIISVVGAEGVHVEDYMKNAVTSSECNLYPIVNCKSVMDLLEGLREHPDAKAILVPNFPMNKNQTERFNEQIGGMDTVITLDCEEPYAKLNAGSKAKEVDKYMEDTLPVLGYYEDLNKLEVVDIQKNSDVARRVRQSIDMTVAKPRPLPRLPIPEGRELSAEEKAGFAIKAAEARAKINAISDRIAELQEMAKNIELSPEEKAELNRLTGDLEETRRLSVDLNNLSARPKLTRKSTLTDSFLKSDSFIKGERPKLKHRDTGRLALLPSTPIIALYGAPSIGMDQYSKAASEKCGGIFLQSENVDELLDKVNNNPEVKVILEDSVPRSQNELEEFNLKIGGMRGAIVIDTPEELSIRNGATKEELDFYKEHTLVILGYFEDNNKLELIKAEEGNIVENTAEAIDRLLTRKGRHYTGEDEL